jgi:hypothetical protein
MRKPSRFDESGFYRSQSEDIYHDARARSIEPEGPQSEDRRSPELSPPHRDQSDTDPSSPSLLLIGAVTFTEDLVAMIPAPVCKFNEAFSRCQFIGPRVIEICSKQFLLDQFIRKHLERSGSITRFKRLSYSHLIAEFLTALMVLRAINRFQRMQHTDYRLHHYTMSFADDVNEAIRDRIADEEKYFDPPKCLIVINFDSPQGRIGNQPTAFDLEDH